MNKDEIKEMLLEALAELEQRQKKAIDREWKGEHTMASNAYWKAEDVIVDVAQRYGINIDADEYEIDMEEE